MSCVPFLISVPEVTIPVLLDPLSKAGGSWECHRGQRDSCSFQSPPIPQAQPGRSLRSKNTHILYLLPGFKEEEGFYKIHMIYIYQYYFLVHYCFTAVKNDFGSMK